MPKGNPNPSPETRFLPGQSGNPGGKTAAQRKAEVEAAEMAAKLRHLMLTRMVELVESGAPPETVLLSPEALRLFKDSEDRAHGTPKQSIDNTSSDGSMTPPREIVLRAYKPGDE